MNTQQRRESDDPAKLDELVRIAAEWGRENYPAPPTPKRCEDGQGLLDKFPWE